MHQNPMSNRTPSVGSEYERLFSMLSSEPAPSYLCEQVLGQIRERRVQRARVRLVAASLVLASSAILTGYASLLVWQGAANSGFLSYLTLIVTDSGTIAAHLSAFSLTLLESLPTVGLMVLFIALAAFLTSLRTLATAFFEQRRLIHLSI
jgi:hypothetical protein